MHPRRKSALLWGVIGAMAFLVFQRGYGVVADASYSLSVTVGIAVVVGVVAAVLSYLVEGRLLYDDPKGSR